MMILNASRLTNSLIKIGLKMTSSANKHQSLSMIVFIMTLNYQNQSTLITLTMTLDQICHQIILFKMMTLKYWNQANSLITTTIKTLNYLKQVNTQIIQLTMMTSNLSYHHKSFKMTIFKHKDLLNSLIICATATLHYQDMTNTLTTLPLIIIIMNLSHNYHQIVSSLMTLK